MVNSPLIRLAIYWGKRSFGGGTFQPFLFGPCNATKEHQLVVKLSSTLPAGETLHTQQISHNRSITNMYYINIDAYIFIYIYIL